MGKQQEKRGKTRTSSRSRGDTRAEHDVDTEESGEEIPLDEIYSILRNRRRRLVLSKLGNAEGSLEIGDLAEQIAAIENDKSVSAVRSKERKRVYISLYQSHLPKLDEVGVVSYDADRGVVERGPHFRTVRETLDGPESDRHPWPMYYLGAIVALGLLFGLGSSLVGVGADVGIWIALAVLASIGVADLLTARNR